MRADARRACPAKRPTLAVDAKTTTPRVSPFHPLGRDPLRRRHAAGGGPACGDPFGEFRRAGPRRGRLLMTRHTFMVTAHLQRPSWHDDVATLGSFSLRSRRRTLSAVATHAPSRRSASWGGSRSMLDRGPITACSAPMATPSGLVGSGTEAPRDDGRRRTDPTICDVRCRRTPPLLVWSDPAKTYALGATAARGRYGCLQSATGRLDDGTPTWTSTAAATTSLSPVV